MKVRVLIVFLFIFLAKTEAQQPSHFFLGALEFEGVQIYDVIQDKAFNYWFATDEGFYKYDGYEFSNVECEGMKGLSAFGFVITKNGVIFCNNLNNQIIKIEDGKCSIFYELEEAERTTDYRLSISHNDEIMVWAKSFIVLNATGRKLTSMPRTEYCASSFNTDNNETITHPSSQDSLLVYRDHHLKKIKLTIQGDTIFGILTFFNINKKTYAINIKNKELYHFNTIKHELTPLIFNNIHNKKEHLYTYNKGNKLWIAGTISGIQVINNPEVDEYTDIIFPEYLISDVFEDNEGNILLSTFNHGVIVIPSLTIPDVLKIPQKKTVVCLEDDSNCGLLLGTLTGELLGYKNNKFQSLSNFGIKPIQEIYSWPHFPFIIFDDGNIKALNKITGEIITILSSYSLKDVALTENNTLLFALNTNICKVNWRGGKNFEIKHLNNYKIRCYSIAESPETGSIIVATSDGLKKITKSGEIENILYKGKRLFVNTIYNQDKTLFIVAKKQGILVYEKDIIVRQILPKINNVVLEIQKIKLKNNKIYTITSHGFFVFSMKGKLITQFNKARGFSTNKIFDFEILENEIWISHSKGVQLVMVNQLTAKIKKPLLLFSLIQVNGVKVNPTLANQQFGSNQRKFKFVISSPTLRNAENVRYYYKLKGYDDEWQIANYTENQIVYNALEANNYVFLVKAENQGVFSETKYFSFSIAAPIYKRWWFTLIAALTIFGIITLIYKRQLRIQSKKAEMKNELNFSKLTAIQSQMNPHFIFNSLNSIQDLVLKGDIDNSYSFITKFSNLIRRTLNYSDKDFIEFEQEYKLIELYLSLEKLRFKNELEYEIIAMDIDYIQVPPMLIQPFLENALIHGLLHKDGTKKIKVTFLLSDVLTCIIEDNGIGREKATAIKLRQRSEHESFSSAAIKKRFSILSQHFNGKLGYFYEDLSEGGIATGTRVTLTIPIKINY
jgi:hypothetical protein